MYKLWGGWTTYISFIIFGILCFTIGIILIPSITTWTSAACGVGIALIVGGITGLVHTSYLQNEILQGTRYREMESIGIHMQENGFYHIFSQRPLVEIKYAIENAKEEILIVGSSLKGLLGIEDPNKDQKEIIDNLLRKIKSGVSLKIFLAHPFVAGYREKMEGREMGSIPVEIVKNLLRLLFEIQMINSKYTSNWNISLYMCGPTVFSCEIDKRILFFQPYPLGGTSMDNLCFQCEIPTKLGSNLKRFMNLHFDEAWEKAKTQQISSIKNYDDISSLVEGLIKKECIEENQYQELKILIEYYKKHTSKE